MRFTFSALTIITFLLMSYTSNTKMDFLFFTKSDRNYRNCAAIFLTESIDEIAPKGKCELFPNMAGALTEANVSLSIEVRGRLKK